MKGVYGGFGSATVHVVAQRSRARLLVKNSPHLTSLRKLLPTGSPGSGGADPPGSLHLPLLFSRSRRTPARVRVMTPVEIIRRKKRFVGKEN